MEDNELGTTLIGCAIQVHRALGPGLLESVYESFSHSSMTDCNSTMRSGSI